MAGIAPSYLIINDSSQDLENETFKVTQSMALCVGGVTDSVNRINGAEGAPTARGPVSTAPCKAGAAFTELVSPH